MSERMRDAAIQLVRALRSDEDVRRIQRVERAIDNQGNPILDNVTIVAGPGGGGTVIVAWGAITGTLTDQADLAAALDSKVTLNGLEWTIVTGSIENLQDAVSALEEAVEDLEAGSGSSVWGSITGTLSDQTDLQNALDGKVGLSSLDWTVVTTSLANAQDDIAALESGKADVSHTHAASDVTSGTFHVDRIPALTIAKITGLQSALDGKADDLDVLILSAAVEALQTNKADATHTHAGSDITSGTIAPARLGTGTPSGSTFLRGDGQWATVPGGLDAEAVRDIIGAALVEGANIDITVNDGADTITIAVTGLDIDDISGLQAALDGKADDLDVTLLSAAVSDLQTNKANVSHQHAAGDVTSGTFADARIPNLAASKITSGTFNEARIPSLPISRITNLQSTLDSKATVSNLNLVSAAVLAAQDDIAVLEAQPQTYTVVIQRLDGGVLQAGDYAEFRVPIACQIDRIAIMSDVTGAVVTTDLFKASYASWPTMSPMSDPGAGPAIASLFEDFQKSEQTAFTNWTTRQLAADDICRIQVVGTPAVVKRLTVHVTVTPV